jgi:hypothetical protein
VVAQIGFCLFGETVFFGKTITMGVVFLIHEVNLLYWLLKKMLAIHTTESIPKILSKSCKKAL